jgi:hypothetical protein
MRTHAEVHEAVEEICRGTTLTEFMIETRSFRHDDGAVAVEWGACIASGRKWPAFYFRANDPDKLVADVRMGVGRRRAQFAIADKSLDSLRGKPPKDTTPSADTLPEPKPSPPLDLQRFGSGQQYHPTGEF